MLKLSGFFRGMLVLFMAIVLGCASYPQARYYKAGDVDPKKKEILWRWLEGDEKGKISFSLQGSLITIAVPPTPQSAPPIAGPGGHPTGSGAPPQRAQESKSKQSDAQLEALGLTNKAEVECNIDGLTNTQAFATQADADDSLYILVPNDTFLTKSNISVSYYDGYHRIKAIGTEFQDDRIKVITAVGSAVATIVTVAMAFEPTPDKAKLQLPLVLDFTNPTKFVSREVFSDWEKVPNYACWYRYKVSTPQKNTVKTEDFFKNHKEYTREFPVSACVDLTLEIGKAAAPGNPEVPEGPKVGDRMRSYTVRVPDPSFVEPLPFPLKGSITTHSVCGADISTQPSQAASTFEILEAIAKQVEAIRQVQQKKPMTTQTTQPQPPKPTPGGK